MLRSGGRELRQERRAEGEDTGLFEIYREESEAAWADSRPVL